MGASIEWSANTGEQERGLPLRGAACVVEPDELYRSGVCSLLRHMGFAVHETGYGTVGAMIADQIRLSVIIVNAMVTDVRGLKLIRSMRDKAPNAVIVALTPDARGLALALVAGANHVLASPPCGEALCSTISHALAQHRRKLDVPVAMGEEMSVAVA